MDAHLSQFKGANRLVEQGSWKDIEAFLRALNARRPTLGVRLPTAAQWEYDCRAGTITACYERSVDAIAWYWENNGRTTHGGGQKRPNTWSLYNMLGNVWERGHDAIRSYTETGVRDPAGPAESGTDRLFWGGGWGCPARHVRAAFRGADRLGDLDDALGFRPASAGSSQPVPAWAAWRTALPQAELAETVPQPPTVPLVRLSQESGRVIGLPPGNDFLVHSDHERLTFGLTKPSWASQIGRDVYGLWVMFEVKGIQQRMRWMPPGRFLMGSPLEEEERYDDEGPQHAVQLTRGFWLCDTPCTQALWQAVMRRNPSAVKGQHRPVEQVSWEECQTFLHRLNAHLSGVTLYLPTEAQWEYACRAGTKTTRYQEDLDTIAWYGDNSQGQTHEVGLKHPNAWGLYDMLGNVWEWCHDDQRDYAKSEGVMVDPLGSTETGANRVVRGGSWNYSARFVRAAYRSWDDPGVRSDYLGFRPASAG